MTEKLYYKDAYIKEFEAVVLSCEKLDGGFDVVLDKTAFFPTEGGQYSDTGTLGGGRVKDVLEKEGVIHHICDTECPVGEKLACKIDFDKRYEKMQCHTGEHILSGLFHSELGLNNVGFHLGEDEVTMDVDAYLDEEDIVKIERLANRVIYENVPVLAYFPDKDELSSLEYRSKLELTENVRIVKIGDYDTCACCAPHVKRTGEVGIIRILDVMKHRGGTRLTIIAGVRALSDYRERYEEIRAVSGLLSVPKNEIASGTARLLSEYEALKFKYKSAREELFRIRAESIENTDGNLVVYYEDASPEELRTVANSALGRVFGMLVLLCGKEGDFKYLIVSESVDLRSAAKDINSNLGGRGGGKPEAIQGSFSASLSDICAYFAK